MKRESSCGRSHEVGWGIVCGRNSRCKSSLRFFLQLAEKRKPCFLINHTFVCERWVMCEYSASRKEDRKDSDTQCPSVSVTTTYLAPNLVKNCCTSSSGLFDCTVSGAFQPTQHNISTRHVSRGENKRTWSM